MSDSIIDDVGDYNIAGEGHAVVSKEAEVILVQEERVEDNESHGAVAGDDIFTNEIHEMDTKLSICCLFILWSFSLVGLFFARFPLAGKIFSWVVICFGSLLFLRTLVCYLGRRRRNMHYVSM